MTTLIQWAQEHIGAPYELGAGGENGTFDCWGMVRKLQEDVYGRKIPDIIDGVSNLRSMLLAFKHDPCLALWHEVKQQDIQDGDCLTLTQHTQTHHVGVIIQGQLLHAIEHVGICYQSLDSLKLNGWIITGAYRYAA